MINKVDIRTECLKILLISLSQTLRQRKRLETLLLRRLTWEKCSGLLFYPSFLGSGPYYRTVTVYEETR